jgi:hypothetical protein
MMSNQSKLTYRYWRQPYARIVIPKYLTHCQKSQGAIAVGSGDFSSNLVRAHLQHMGKTPHSSGKTFMPN